MYGILVALLRNCEIKSIATYGVFVEIAPGREVSFPDIINLNTAFFYTFWFITSFFFLVAYVYHTIICKSVKLNLILLATLSTCVIIWSHISPLET